MVRVDPSLSVRPVRAISRLYGLKVEAVGLELASAANFPGISA